MTKGPSKGCVCKGAPDDQRSLNRIVAVLDEATLLC